MANIRQFSLVPQEIPVNGQVAEAVSSEELEVGKVEDVVRILRVTKSNVYKLCERGALPYFKVGGLLRFDLKEIRGLARQQPPVKLHRKPRTPKAE